MADLGLGTGERRLLAAVARLREVDPGPLEPAPLFHAPTAAGPGSSWQGLEAAVAEAGFDPSNTDAEARAPAADGEDRAIPSPPEGAAALTAAVARGDLDPEEVVDNLLARIEAHDPSLNAFVTVTSERARRDARALRERLERGEAPPPLAGVPLIHKDIVLTGGIRTTAGSALLAEYVPGEDAAMAVGLRRAGTLLAGKGNTHEFATGPTGTVSVHGPTRNPWDRSRMAGGSSTGSAAALAAGMAVLATGTDTGGSIRIPAACCGITGLKPTYGRVDRDGVVPFAWSLDHVGPMARSVDDVALQFGALLDDGPGVSGEGRGDDTGGDPDRPDRNLRDNHLDGLRFAVVDPFLEASRPDVAAAVEEAAGVLTELGAIRSTLDPLPELDLVAPAAVAIFLAEGGAVHDRLLARFPQGYQEETRAFLELAPRVDSVAYVQAQRVRSLVMHAVAGAMAELDLLVCPTLPVTAPPLDARTVSLPQGDVDVRAALTRFTRPFNLTGQPALSLPCGFVDGLPVGLQLVGRPHGDELVLAAGRAYQEATDWHRRWPPGYGPSSTAPGG